jgi:hypothetical protein
MSSAVAVRARHPRAFLLIGLIDVHLRFRFPGLPSGAGLAKHYQLGAAPHDAVVRVTPAGRDGYRASVNLRRRIVLSM